MTVQMIAIGNIKPNARNARTHSTKQIQQIANSIDTFGFTNPLLLSEDGELIAGHGRYEAAKLLGLAEVPVIVVRGLSPAKRRALAIADNKIAENAGWNRERLAIEIPELADLLSTDGLDISILGFEAVEIEHIETDLEEPAADPRDRIDPKWCEAITVSKPGDLWLLGDHKLLCGDFRSGDVARLMTDCRADLAFIDSLAIRELSSADVLPVLKVAFDAAASVSRKGAIHFVGMDWQNTAECMAAAKPVYGEAINVIVWVKSTASEGSFYQNQYELIGMFRVGQPPHLDMKLHRSGRQRSNVWRYGGAHSFGLGGMEALRPSPKPVALFADAIRDCTNRGDVVLDIFSGWGSLIMAAEHVGRRARALETEPRLVDLAIRRWQNVTRSGAWHVESGLSFEQIAADRTLSGHRVATTKRSRGRL